MKFGNIEKFSLFGVYHLLHKLHTAESSQEKLFLEHYLNTYINSIKINVEPEVAHVQKTKDISM